MLTHNKPFESLADGYVQIYAVKNVAAEGDRPREGLSQIVSLPFDYKTVGYNRYWKAEQADVKISAVISVPYRPQISTQEIAVIGTTQYYIRQVQRIKDTRPETLKLSLEKVVENYEIENPEL